jgi:hypothetical protein
MNLIFNTRIYFRRLVTWTRAYLLSRYLGIGTAEELFGRLYLESLDLGNMLEIVFGSELANQDAQLASQYAIGLRDLITAQLAGDTAGVDKHVKELYQNAADRAAFGAKINPYWDKDELTRLLNNYIQYTLEEANALTSGDYTKESEPYERLTALTEELGDFIAQGLYEYITSGTQSAPNPQSRCECITSDQLNSIYRIRMFWYELVSLIRNFMISRYKNLGKPAEEFFYNELKRATVNYTNALRKIFGDKVPQDYIQLFYTYFELIDAFVTAQMVGNTDEIDRITKLLYQNADQRAAAISAMNPFWDQTVWKDKLYNNLRSTIDESTTFLSGDYARNIDIFNTLLNQAESTGNYFTQGLLKYLYQQCQQS